MGKQNNNGSVLLESTVNLLKMAYREFNTRNLEAVLATMQPGVEWPNGMEGGTVHGHSGVRDNWTRQWARIDAHVDPIDFETGECGQVVVTVHQVVRDLHGKLLLDRIVTHMYTIEDGLIRRMEIGD
jgi:SnoaL-like domain